VVVVVAVVEVVVEVVVVVVAVVEVVAEAVAVVVVEVVAVVVVEVVAVVVVEVVAVVVVEVVVEVVAMAEMVVQRERAKRRRTVENKNNENTREQLLSRKYKNTRYRLQTSPLPFHHENKNINFVL
jgi:hypothetical protein